MSAIHTGRRLTMAGALAALATSTLGPWTRALAAARLRTPAQTEGPFYPRALALAHDSDLADPGVHGQITHVAGRLLDEDGRAVAGTRVEIWQADAFGHYHHPNDTPRDPAFRGFGATVSADDGTYRFRTIRPVPYTGRAPHIHFAIAAPGAERLVTQMYVAGEASNARDFVLNAIRDPAVRASVIFALAPAPEIEAGSLAATFDIVLGRGAAVRRG